MGVLRQTAQASAPGDDGAVSPQAAGAAFDGTTQEAEAPKDPFAFAAQPVAAQIAATGWYGGAPKLIRWSQASDGNGWIHFYRGLYKALAADGPKGYRQDTPAGPVFHLGGHDVVQTILGLSRTVPGAEVNLLGSFSSPLELLDTWKRLDVDAGPRGKLDVMVNPESTQSLDRMVVKPATADALDRVQDNIFLKWNLVSLTPEGVEIRALDARAARDLERRELRLSTNRGLLSGYEAQYNLIVAFRAFRETGKTWRFDEATKRFFAKSLSEMPKAELEEALSLAARNPSVGGMHRLLDFIALEVGKSAAGRARAVARDMPREQGGLLEEGVPDALIERYRPLRTAAQLKELERSVPAVAGRARFALIGDAEPGRFWFSRVLFNIPGVFRRLLKRAQLEHVDFVVQLGDMVSRGTVKNYERFFGILSTVRFFKPYLTVLGNHDRARPHGVTNARVYRSLFGPRTDYTFDREGVRFVVLDTSAGRATRDQLDWLDKQLDFPGTKILFTHIPPAYLAEWTDAAGLKGVGGFKPGAQRFREIVERRKVARVYLGHIHAFDTLEKNGVRYVLTGGGGSALFPSKIARKFHHYLVVEAGPEGVTETVRRDDGRSFDIEWPR